MESIRDNLKEWKKESLTLTAYAGKKVRVKLHVFDKNNELIATTDENEYKIPKRRDVNDVLE
jgi:hypothetical protein